MSKKIDNRFQETVAKGLAWARVQRMGLAVGLSRETLKAVRGELLDWLQPSDDARVKVAPERPLQTRFPADEATQVVLPRESLELELRHLVEADAPFDQIRAVVLRLFHDGQQPETAAKGVELAFLNGSTEDLLALMEQFFKVKREFYWHIHPAVRCHTIVRLWKDGLANGLAVWLMPERWHTDLQPVERLFLFRTMLGASDPSIPYNYFRKYREQLVSAVSELGDHFDLTPSRFLLQVGKMAITLGYDDDARSLLYPIGDSDPEYGDAMAVLLSIRAGASDQGHAQYAERLRANRHYLGTIDTLREFLSVTRELGGVRDVNRPELNDVLGDILSFVPMEGEAWLALSRLLVENRDLALLLPNITEVYRLRALDFSKPDLNEALWAPVIAAAASRPDDIEGRYWAGIGKLHLYISHGPKLEKILWDAREEVTTTERLLKTSAPLRWDELHKAARAVVTRDPRRTEADRSVMMQQLRLATSGFKADPADIDLYVRHATHPPLKVLRSLREIASVRNCPDVELRLILREAKESHFTNDHLDRCWQLACTLKQSDFAWRLASVAHSRQALTNTMVHPWSISGEKRRDYPLVPASLQAVEFCISGFTADESRLAHALVEVGGSIPEVLALLDESARAVRRATYKTDSTDYRIEKLLDKISWVSNARKRYVFAQDDLGGTTRLPAFMHVMPQNPWSSLVVQLADRLGLNAWHWKFSHLQLQMEELIPKLAYRQGLRSYSSKVARWLKSLTPEQRTSWQDIASLGKALGDVEASDALARFICRMATVIYQNHYLALTSLRTMRADLPIIHDLELWILSEEYTQMREKLGMASRVPVPASLARLKRVTQS